MAQLAPHPRVMHTCFRALRLAGPTLGQFLSLPSGGGHYQCCRIRGGASVPSAIWPCCFLPGRGLARITRCLPGYLHRRGLWSSFPCGGRSGALLTRSLALLLRQDHVFSLLSLGGDRFHAAGAQLDPAILSFALPIPPASSPYLDANAGIGLRATESPDCSTLKLS